MFKELKREAYEANVALPRHGLINLTFGNASAVDRARAVFAIKPSGIDYAALTPDDMVIVDFEGRKVEGSSQPLVGHPHPPQAVPRLPEYWRRRAYALDPRHRLRASRPADPELRHDACRLFQWRGAGHPQAERQVRSPTDYEWETGNVIVETMQNRDPADCPGVLVNRHAPFTWGSSVAKAVEAAVALECIAHMALMSLQLNPRLEPIEEELLNKHFQRKHGPQAYYGQTSGG